MSFSLTRISGPTTNNNRLSRVVPFIKAAAAEWSPDKLRGYIQSGEVPQNYVKDVIDQVKKDPTLIVIQKEDFLAGVAEVYPELHTLLTSPAGDAWLEKCLLGVGKGIFTSALSFLRGG